MGYHFERDFIIDYDYVDKKNKLTYKGFLKYLRGARKLPFRWGGIWSKWFWKNSFGLASLKLETSNLQKTCK